MKTAYIICATVSELVWLILAIITPKWITPGYYWWSALMVLFIVAQSKAFTERLNTWQKQPNS